jgi:plastocyanin
MLDDMSNRGRLSLVAAVVLLGVAAIALIAWRGVLTPRVFLSVEARDLSSIRYAFEPDPLIAPASTEVALTFVNSSAQPHNLVLLAPIDVRTDHSVAPGATRRLEFTTPGAGTYRFVCTIHEGMSGTLRIQ